MRTIALPSAREATNFILIEGQIVQRERRAFYYRTLYLKSLDVLERWIEGGRPINEYALPAALKVSSMSVKVLYRRYPQLRKLITDCQRVFGTQVKSVMGLAAIKEAKKRPRVRQPAG